jgi:aspartyl-tRNA synthetase
MSTKPADMIKEKRTTEAIEMVAAELVIHNICDILLFPMSDLKIGNISQELQLTCRHLDLRRPKSFQR